VSDGVELGLEFALLGAARLSRIKFAMPRELGGGTKDRGQNRVWGGHGHSIGLSRYAERKAIRKKWGTTYTRGVTRGTLGRWGLIVGEWCLRGKTNERTTHRDQEWVQPHLVGKVPGKRILNGGGGGGRALAGGRERNRGEKKHNLVDPLTENPSAGGPRAKVGGNQDSWLPTSYEKGKKSHTDRKKGLRRRGVNLLQSAHVRKENVCRIALHM